MTRNKISKQISRVIEACNIVPGDRLSIPVHRRYITRTTESPYRNVASEVGFIPTNYTVLTARVTQITSQVSSDKFSRERRGQVSFFNPFPKQINRCLAKSIDSTKYQTDIRNHTLSTVVTFWAIWSSLHCYGKGKWSIRQESIFRHYKPLPWLL